MRTGPLQHLCFYSGIALSVMAFTVHDPQMRRLVPSHHGPPARHTRARVGHRVEIGIASWYGERRAGKLTASGVPFDPHKLTAAHNTLPLNTKAKVTNLANRRSVEVTINDRGPGVPGRVIDLSERAAKQLGMKKEGLALVRIEPLPSKVAALD